MASSGMMFILSFVKIGCVRKVKRVSRWLTQTHTHTNTHAHTHKHSRTQCRYHKPLFHSYTEEKYNKNSLLTFKFFFCIVFELFSFRNPRNVFLAFFILYCLIKCKLFWLQFLRIQLIMHFPEANSGIFPFLNTPVFSRRLFRNETQYFTNHICSYAISKALAQDAVSNLFVLLSACRRIIPAVCRIM
jgi:hypothetical protein